MADRKILFVLPWFPYPLDSGGKQAIFNGIKAASGYAKLFITFKAKEDIDIRLRESFIREVGECEIIPYNVEPLQVNVNKDGLLLKLFHNYKKIRHRIKIALKKLAGIKSPIIEMENAPEYLSWASVIYPFDEAFAMFVRRIVLEKSINIVQCEMIKNSSIVYFLPQKVKKIFVHHELRTVRYKLESENISGDEAIKNAYLCFFEGCEVSVLNKFDTVITLSDVDKIKLTNSGVSANIVASSAIVNTPICKTPKTDRYHTLSFVGSDSHNPNLVGIMWFLENCWTTLLETDSSYSLQIIGKWSEYVKETIRNHFPNIIFTGFVPDLAKAIEGTIMIVPITIGSGIRMKILEAASIGCPIVSTSIGAEGIPLSSGINCFIADTPLSFVESITKLKDPDIRTRFVNSAQDIITQNYTFESFKKSRIEIFDQLFNTIQ